MGSTPEVSAVKNEAGDGAGNGGQVGALVDKEGLAPRLPFTEQVKHLSEGLVAGAVDQTLVLPRLLCGQLGHRDHDLVTVSVLFFSERMSLQDWWRGEGADRIHWILCK